MEIAAFFGELYAPESVETRRHAAVDRDHVTSVGS